MILGRPFPAAFPSGQRHVCSRPCVQCPASRRALGEDEKNIHMLQRVNTTESRHADNGGADGCSAAANLLPLAHCTTRSSRAGARLFGRHSGFSATESGSNMLRKRCDGMGGVEGGQRGEAAFLLWELMLTLPPPPAYCKLHACPFPITPPPPTTRCRSVVPSPRHLLVRVVHTAQTADVPACSRHWPRFG